MEIELVPDPGADAAVADAAMVALSQSGLLDREPAAAGGAWQRAGLEEAIDRSAPARAYATGSPSGDAMGRGSVPPAPSRRGATRA
jgi:hypothetical protein